MRKKISYALAVLVGIVIIFWAGIYWQHRTYFAGAVRTYMVAQRIPEKRIKSQKIDFNWINMGQWEEDVFIRAHHKTYQYNYSMDWDTKKVMLTVYLNRDGLKDSETPYPPLAYDNDAGFEPHVKKY